MANNVASSGKVSIPVYEKANANGELYLELAGLVAITTDDGDDAPLNGFYCFDRQGMRQCTPGKEEKGQEEARGFGTVTFQEIPRIIPPIRCAAL